MGCDSLPEHCRKWSGGRGIARKGFHAAGPVEAWELNAGSSFLRRCPILVLSRRVGEVLTIGENIKITVTQIRGDKVRIGIEAPKEVRILRDELKDKEAGK